METQPGKTHYICAGECGGVSDKPGTCQDKACSMYTQALHECHCEDGLHRQDIPTNSAPAPAL